MPTSFPPTRVIESPGTPNTTFWSEDFGAYVDAFTSGTWPLNIGIDLDPMLWFLTPMDTPLSGTVTADGSVIMPSRECDETEIYWGTEDAIVPYSQVKVAIASAATTTLDVDDARRFRVGDIIKVSTEMMKVTAVVDDDSLTVTRDYNGVLGGGLASIPIDTNVYALGRVAPEGSDALEMDSRDVDMFSNYTQIQGPYSIKFTRTMQSIRHTLIPDTVSHQLAKNLKEINLRREFNLFHGVKSKNGRERTAGGVRHFVEGAGLEDSTSTTITSANVGTLLGRIWGRGGMDGALILQANPASFATLNADNSSQVNVVYAESRRGLTPVQFVDTEYGSVQCVRNRWYSGSEATLYTAGQPVRRILRPVAVSQLPSSGDYDAWMVVGEETLQFNAPQISGIFTALTYTSAVPTSG